jgi:hypothetical protein
MPTFRYPILLATLLLISGWSRADGQPADSSGLRNIVRINVSNPVLFGIKNNVFGYERIFQHNRSASLNMGRFSFPAFEPFITDTISLARNYRDHGFNFALDYRIYLKRENKYDAPRGLYMGPYYAFNYLKRENHWTFNTEGYTGEMTSELKVNMHLVGFQLGYQFVIWRRFMCDVVFMGPGLWFFNMKSVPQTSLSPEDKALFYEKLNEQLESKFPGYDFAADGSDIRKSGSFRSGRVGYRYLVNIGYRF